MDERFDAGQKLLAQHTVHAPQIAFEAALQRLTSFVERNGSLTGKPLRDAVIRDVDAQDAAIAFLKYRFTPVGAARVDLSASAATCTGVALGLVAHLDLSHRTEFLEQVVFNVAHPANQGALAPSVLASMAAEELDAALLERVQSSNELHVHNALHLFREIEEERRRAGVNSNARHAFYSAAERLRHRTRLNLLIELALDQLED